MMNKLQNIIVKRSASQRAGAAFLCTLIAFVLAFVIAPSLAWAEPESGEDGSETSGISTAASEIVTVDAVRDNLPSSTSSTLSATVTYDSAFKAGKTIRFTYNVSGNTKPLKYMLYSFKMQTADGWISVLDSTQGQYFNWSDNNYFEEKFYSPGNYELKFAVGEYTLLDNGNPLIPGYVRFTLNFTVDESGDLKSIDAKAQEIADKCKEACGDTDQYACALWLNDWLVANCEYDQTCVYNSAETVFNRRKSACEGYHAAYVMLLNKLNMGIETRTVDSKGDNHVWTGVKLDGKWYNVDTTWNDSSSTGSTGIDGKHLYFALPSSIMQLVHPKWDGTYKVDDKTRAPFDAVSYDDNYYIKENKIQSFCDPYKAESGDYSIKSHLATKFSVPLVNNWPQENYKAVIYSLVAHQLEQENWGDGVKVSICYSNGSLSCSAIDNGTTPAQPITNAIVYNIVDKEYNTKAITQSPKIVLNGKELVEGRDYKLSYKDNIDSTEVKRDSAGNKIYAVMTIEGIGGYFGSFSKVFDIKRLDLDKVTIDAPAGQKVGLEYQPGGVTPTPKVRVSDVELDKSNFTYSYANNSKVGTASLTITAKGSNCVGSKTIKFEILAKNLPSPSLSVSKVYYDGSEKRPVVVKDGSTTLVEGTDYTIAYSNNKNVGKATAVVTGKGNYKGTASISFAIEEKPNTGSSTSSSGSSGSSSSNTSSSGATTPPAATSTAGSNSSVTPSKPAAVTTQSKPQTQSVSGAWKKSGGKWWFSYDAKTQAAQKKKWPANEWVTIGGKRYHFDSKGYMHANWQKLDNKWYYFGSDGAMKTGWQKVSGKWYYLHTDGIMRTGKINPGDGKTYFLTPSGAMKTGWNKEGGGWYYYTGSGAMAKGWAKVGGKWYYLNPSTGLMQTGFYKVGNSWYYSNGSGAMLTGWQKISGKWYYFNGSGAMQYNKWVGNYYVGSNGVMATNTWIGKYHVNANGKWDRTK